MRFEPSSHHVSHDDLPGGLVSKTDWMVFGLDLARERIAVSTAWTEFRSQHDARVSDLYRYRLAQSKLAFLQRKAVIRMQLAV